MADALSLPLAIQRLLGPLPAQTLLFLLLALVVFLWVAPCQLFIMLGVGMAFAAWRPDIDSLPTAPSGVLSRLSAVFSSGSEEPEVLDVIVVLIVVHRQRVFVGALGRWLEVPKAWGGVVELATRSASAIAKPPTEVRQASSEAEARRLRRQCDFVGAAAAFEALEQSDPEIGIRERQRYAEETGQCWLEAGRPEAALPALHRAVSQAIDLRSRGAALESLINAGAALREADQADVVLRDAIVQLVRIVQADAQHAEYIMQTALLAMMKTSERHIQANRFVAAADLLAEAICQGINGSEDMNPSDIRWLRNLDSCIWRWYLCAVLRDHGDSVAASTQINDFLRLLPVLVSGRGVACILDAARAVEDADLEALENASFELDQTSGPLSSWQLEALLGLKNRLDDEDLS